VRPIGSFLVTLAIGLLGAIGIGLVLVDPIAMGLALVLVGGIAGLVTGAREGGLGLAVGVFASLFVLAAIDLLTPLRTIVNKDGAALLGSIPLLAVLWVGFAVASLAGFAVASVIGRRFLL
jgi:hypothetical protein